MRISFLYFFFILALFFACKHEIKLSPLDVQLEESILNSFPAASLQHYTLPGQYDYENIPQDPQNLLNPQKVALGQYLFYETAMAQLPIHPEGMGTWSCASCHLPTAGFRPGNVQGIADGGTGYGLNGEGRTALSSYLEEELDVQGLRPISILNVAFVENAFWNGQFGAGFKNEGTEAQWNEEDKTTINELGYTGIESQSLESMNIHRMLMTKELAETHQYKSLFDLAFREVPEEERYTNFYAAMAISAYLRTLNANLSPFQEWLRGNKTAMSKEEKQGAVLFFGKANCSNCHNNTNLGANEFYALGVNDLHSAGGLATGPDDKKNLGRGGFTQRAEDLYKFKVPQLYNLKDGPFYFHGSSKETLDEVIEYFDKGIPENDAIPLSQISPKFLPLNLTDEEKSQLKIFLEESLHDPYLGRYVPPYVLSGNCTPNNDPESRADLNCN